MPIARDQRADADSPPLSPTERADRLRGVSLWLSQLDRAVRSSLLYGPQSPAMARIRAPLAESLIQLLRRFDPLVLRFDAEGARLEQEQVLLESSVRDGLVVLLHREGIRGLTFRWGVEAAEVDALVDAIAQVSGPPSGESDLVTALWEADFQHLELDVAPLEAAFVPDLEDEEPDGEPILPWPAVSGAGDDALPSGGAPEAASGSGATPGRSDDWPEATTVGAALAAAAVPALAPPPEVERLRAAYAAEQARPLLEIALETARACLATIPHGEKIPELRQFLLRALRRAVETGDWKAASAALEMAAPPGSPPETGGEIGRQILGAVSVPETIRSLDRQPPEAVNGFVAWARELGDAAPEWLFHAMAESQERRYRRLLAQSLAEACRSNVAALAPWMSDPRWYVVRNLVFVLGLIGGDAIGPLVRQASSHPERRVRRQCLVALGTMSPAAARPILLGLLRDPDPDLFRGALDLLVAHRDAATARSILETLRATEGAHRAEGERAALAEAVVATAGVGSLPLLERLFAGDHGVCRQPAVCRALAAAVARLGTAEAAAFLRRGARSRHGAVRAACAAALGSAEDGA